MSSSTLASPPNRSAGGPGVAAVGVRDFAGLPEPVASYFRRVIPLGIAPPSSITLEQTGEIRLGRRWRPFSATEILSAPPASFIWDARVRMAPLVTTRVRDSYDRGVGTMHASMAGLFTVADASNSGPLNTAALHRYLAECVWLPTALLPRYAVVWTPIDRARALATLTDAGNRVSLEFTFTAGGEVAQVFTPARARAVDGGFESTPWRVRMTRYGERAGLWVPIEAEVAWEIDAEWQACWRGRLGRVAGDQEARRDTRSPTV